MNDAFDLTGQVAVVVGAAAGGLGEWAARALAAKGASLALADVPERAGDLKESSGRCAGVTTTHAVDVTSETSVDDLIRSALAEHGRIDILVNAAGVMLRKAFDETSLAEFERVIQVNLTGTWLLNRAVGRSIGQGGRIVNLTTVYAERVGPIPETAYYASKAGVANLTRAMASELGPRGVVVNALAPGVFFPTKMTAPLGDNPSQLEWFAKRTMLGRLGDPESDLAGPLLFLASKAASYVTGQVVYVDGGWSAW